VYEGAQGSNMSNAPTECKSFQQTASIGSWVHGLLAAAAVGESPATFGLPCQLN
jgi:hypothetical protein